MLPGEFRHHLSAHLFQLWLLECVVYGFEEVDVKYDASKTNISFVLIKAKRNRRTTAQQVANQFLAASQSRSPEKLLPDV
ncbi:hypothetical protein TNCV_3560621 [Trichonephila clavipes]|nr:hypothetical protein TNCV_3560621 [Trichonephila clavipes]